MTYFFTGCFTYFFLTLREALFSSCLNWTQAGVEGEGCGSRQSTRHSSTTTTITLFVDG